MTYTPLTMTSTPIDTPVLTWSSNARQCSWSCDSMADAIGLIHWLIFPANVRRNLR